MVDEQRIKLTSEQIDRAVQFFSDLLRAHNERDRLFYQAQGHQRGVEVAEQKVQKIDSFAESLRAELRDGIRGNVPILQLWSPGSESPELFNSLKAAGFNPLAEPMVKNVELEFLPGDKVRASLNSPSQMYSLDQEIVFGGGEVTLGNEAETTDPEEDTLKVEEPKDIDPNPETHSA